MRASRKIPVEPVHSERANRPRKLDPGVQEAARVRTRLVLSLSSSLRCANGSRLLHLEELLHTLGANNSWPRGTRPAERLPYSPPFVRGQGRFPSLAFVRIPLLRSANSLLSSLFYPTFPVHRWSCKWSTRRNVFTCPNRRDLVKKGKEGQIDSRFRGKWKRRKKEKYPGRLRNSRERLTHSAQSLASSSSEPTSTCPATRAFPCTHATHARTRT